MTKDVSLASAMKSRNFHAVLVSIWVSWILKIVLPVLHRMGKTYSISGRTYTCIASTLNCFACVIITACKPIDTYTMAREDFAFFHTLRVRWAEADMQGIVFNGHYLTYFDVAFTEYWRATELPTILQQAKDGRELFARKATIEYQAPARFDDVLDIGVRCVAFGRSSVRFILEIYRADEYLVSGELVYVYADTAARKGIALPDDWRAVLSRFEKLPPAVA
jgi:acyl-CoA thioester hydrolase